MDLKEEISKAIEQLATIATEAANGSPREAATLAEELMERLSIVLHDEEDRKVPQ